MLYIPRLLFLIKNIDPSWRKDFQLCFFNEGRRDDFQSIIVMRLFCHSMKYFNQRESESHHYQKKKIKIAAATAPRSVGNLRGCCQLQADSVSPSHSRHVPLASEPIGIYLWKTYAAHVPMQHTTPAKLFQRLTMIRSRVHLSC